MSNKINISDTRNFVIICIMLFFISFVIIVEINIVGNKCEDKTIKNIIQYQRAKDMCESECYLENRTMNILGRYYHNSEVYCVSLRNRSIEEINKTDYHEMCHHLVKKQGEHFCQGWCEQ